MEELEEYEVEQRDETFVIKNDEDASFATRKLRDLVSRQMANQAVADKEIKRLESWLQAVNSALDFRVNYYRGLLIDYMRREREKGRKSINLPYGTVKSQKNPDKVELDDEFTEWAVVNAKHLLKFADAPPPKPVLKAVKEAIESGEQIEHAKIVEGGVSFSVEVK